ncbi:adenylate kinase [Thermoproteota archaeon]
MKIVMLGPPGSGKSTMAYIISELYRIPIITTGDMLREAVSDKTEFGKIAEGYMATGDLVPNYIVNCIVRERMSRPDVRNGFILDGFPRSLAQNDALDQILEDLDMELSHVLYVVLSDEVIIQRLSKRRSCHKCGAVYHLESAPPEKTDVCNICGAKLIQRDDDKEDVIKHRLEVYRKNTESLLERYRARDRIVETSGEIPMKKLKIHLKELLG